MFRKRIFDFWKPKLHCIGDSHLDVMERVQSESTLKSLRIELCAVRGASNMGLANPRSQTNAATIFSAYLLKNVRRRDQVLFCLGEVDCGFVIWYRALKHSADIEQQFELSFRNYTGLLDQARSRCAMLIVMSVPLPTIVDGQDWGDVASARREVISSQLERTALTVRYNSLLKEYCERNGAKFMDLERETIDPLTGLVKAEYLNPDPLDHHLDREKLASLVTCKLRELGFT